MLMLREFDYYQQNSKQIQSVISYFLSKLTFTQAFTIFKISYNSNLYLVKLVSLNCQKSSLTNFFEYIVSHQIKKVIELDPAVADDKLKNVIIG